MLTADLVLSFRISGVLGYCLPRRLWGVARWLDRGSWAAFVVLMPVGISKRAKVEEQILKENFKDEWEEWHQKTARFIPELW
jgi:protein-S-isoprenylcysteine O-methyltransferase Ste14